VKGASGIRRLGVVLPKQAVTYGRLPEKGARWCCLVQTQFKVEVGAAGMGVDTAATLLVSMLSKRGINATASQLMKLIKLGQRWGHFVDTQLLFSVSEWRALGKTMWEKTITGEEKEEKEIKAVRELWRTVLETLKATASSPQQADEAPFQKCLMGSPALVRPGRWSDIIRDAILDRQWGAAANKRSTQALACPGVQVKGHGKWEPHDWKILQQARNTISQYGVKAEAT